MSLDLKNDIIFKEFFSRKGNEKFLKEFLESLLKISITNIQIMRDVSLERLSVEEKLGILDLQAILDDRKIVSIEMQLRDENNITKRNGYYSAKELASDVKKREKYQEFRPVIMVNILGFKLTNYEEYISQAITVLKDHREYEIDTGMTYYFIELPKFRKAKPDMNDKLDQWLAFIDNEDRGLIEMAKEKNETIKRAAEELEYLTGDEEVRRMAYLHEKWERDYESGMEGAREEGRSAGKLEGKIEGRAEGMQEVAKKMKEKNMSLETIIELTGLSKEEIEKLWEV